MNRRGFLKAILAAGVAPAFIGSSVLMPVRASRIWTFSDSIIELVGDGIADDTAALQAWIDGVPVMYQGMELGPVLAAGHFKITSTLELSRPIAGAGNGKTIISCRFDGPEKAFTHVGYFA